MHPAAPLALAFAAAALALVARRCAGTRITRAARLRRLRRLRDSQDWHRIPRCDRLAILREIRAG